MMVEASWRVKSMTGSVRMPRIDAGGEAGPAISPSRNGPTQVWPLRMTMIFSRAVYAASAPGAVRTGRAPCGDRAVLPEEPAGCGEAGIVAGDAGNPAGHLV